jgi:hypothetical protein
MTFQIIRKRSSKWAGDLNARNLKRSMAKFWPQTRDCARSPDGLGQTPKMH